MSLESPRRYSLRRSNSVLNLDQASMGSVVTTKLNRNQCRDSIKTGNRSNSPSPDQKHLRCRTSASKINSSIPSSSKALTASDESFSANNFDSKDNSKRHLRRLITSDQPEAHIASPLQSPTPRKFLAQKTLYKNSSNVPVDRRPTEITNSALQNQDGKSFYTPQNYNLVKPLQTAFLSTGLLSKRLANAKRITAKSLPPGTPCKPAFLYSSDLSTSPVTPSFKRQFFKSIHRTGKDDTKRESKPPGTPHSARLKDCRTPITPTRGHNHHLNEYDEINYKLQKHSQTKESKMHQNSARSKRFNEDLNTSAAFFGEPGRKFCSVVLLGTGKFSSVYEVQDADTNLKYAIKKSRRYSGYKERQRRYDEVEVLRQLTDHEHVVQLIDFWDHDDHLYMQMELCENGSFDAFLREIGKDSQLDEFRVWKVLTELSLGLNFVHQNGFLHLDIKPANILITFEGDLKLGDFGMATKWPANRSLEREGDREYIAPEIMESHLYEKPADVFSLGLTILETAANIELPENGLSWQKLRSGDLSDAPRLFSSGDFAHEDSESFDVNVVRTSVSAPAAPAFQTDQGSDSGSSHPIIGQGYLDRIVRWMISPNPEDRPTITEVLDKPEVKWVNEVRRAGAIVYEGDFGPFEELNFKSESHDAMMEDWHVS